MLTTVSEKSKYYNCASQRLNHDYLFSFLHAITMTIQYKTNEVNNRNIDYSIYIQYHRENSRGPGSGEASGHACHPGHEQNFV